MVQNFNSNNNNNSSSSERKDVMIFHRMDEILEYCRKEKYKVIADLSSTSSSWPSSDYMAKSLRKKWDEIEGKLIKAIAVNNSDNNSDNDSDDSLSFILDLDIPFDVDMIQFCKQIYDIIPTSPSIDFFSSSHSHSVDEGENKEKSSIVSFPAYEIDFIRSKVFDTPNVPSYADAKVLFAFLYFKELRPHEGGWISYTNEELSTLLREYKKLPSSNENNLNKIIKRLYSKRLIDFRVVGKEKPITCFNINFDAKLMLSCASSDNNNHSKIIGNVKTLDNQDNLCYNYNYEERVGEKWFNPNLKWENFDDMFKFMIVEPILLLTSKQ